MTSNAQDPASYFADEMKQLLQAGATVTGTCTAAAAIHLLCFTGLPGTAAFARHVRVKTAPDVRRTPVLGAWVKDWRVLLSDQRIYLTGGDERLLRVAASYAAGLPVDLDRYGVGFGRQYARRLIEAVIIGAGMAGYYTVETVS